MPDAARPETLCSHPEKREERPRRNGTREGTERLPFCKAAHTFKVDSSSLSTAGRRRPPRPLPCVSLLFSFLHAVHPSAHSLRRTRGQSPGPEGRELGWCCPSPPGSHPGGSEPQAAASLPNTTRPLTRLSSHTRLATSPPGTFCHKLLLPPRVRFPVL